MFCRAWISLAAIGLVAVGSETSPSLKAADKPAADLSGFPKLTGKLSQLLGHEGGFLRPKAGEPFQLALADLAKVKKLAFDPKSMSYVPLPGPLTVEALHHYGNGAFKSMRLVSRDEGVSRVWIDIVPKPGAGPNRVLVWVVIESDRTVQGVALIECEADGAFPGRRK